MANPKEPETCPVDHKSREAWLAQAKAASSSAQVLAPSHPTVGKSTGEESCPVDHKSREAWLQQARSASSSRPIPQKPTIPSATPTSSSSWTTSLWSWVPFTQAAASPSPNQSATAPAGGLATAREVSTIPRTAISPPDPESPSTSSSPSTISRGGGAPRPPANSEQETGADATSGNWIYPSERMFFDAMKRKGHDPRSNDMRSIVPIHNAVNERAWAEIKKWEEPWIQGTTCGGPRLHSFSGLSTKMSPKARINTLLGYQAPFDRHDWVVDRCGREIEYIIDFYAGRGNGGPLSFYLDVRPKLNSWEGIKMRAARTVGLM